MYNGVPLIEVITNDDLLIDRANPKSQTLTHRSVPINMFCGFKSL